MGITEEAGKVAENITASLRNQPILLGLLIINLCTLLLMWFFVSVASSNRTQDIKLIYDNQKQVQDLLARCGKVSP